MSPRQPHVLPPTERRRQILAALSPHQVTSVDALARLTGASAITIRRDLAELADADLVRRVHGGASLATRRGDQHPYALRADEDLEAKRILARAAAALIQDGESVILDAGTTSEMIAEELAGHDLTVMALSLRIAARLARIPGVRTVIPGGPVEAESLSTISITAVDQLRDFRADTGILGACAVSAASGLGTANIEDVSIKRALIASSNRILCPATTRKLGRSSNYRFADVSAVDELLLTDDAPTVAITELRQAGAHVSLHSQP